MTPAFNLKQRCYSIFLFPLNLFLRYRKAYLDLTSPSPALVNFAWKNKEKSIWLGVLRETTSEKPMTPWIFPDWLGLLILVATYIKPVHLGVEICMWGDYTSWNWCFAVSFSISDIIFWGWKGFFWMWIYSLSSPYLSLEVKKRNKIQFSMETKLFVVIFLAI